MAKPLTKNQIIKKLSEQSGVASKDVKNVLSCLNEMAVKEVKSNGQFRICDLGKLKLRKRAARTMRNPQTGKPIKVPAKKVVKFTVAKAVKEKVAK